MTQWLATAAAYLVPNFSALNIISSVAHGAAGCCATDSLQHRLCAGLRRHGVVRGGADLRAPEPEMNGSRNVTITAVCASGGLPGRFHVFCCDGSISYAPAPRWKMFSTSRSPKAVKRLSLGYDGLLADIYWTRAVQYFGGHTSREQAISGAGAAAWKSRPRSIRTWWSPTNSVPTSCRRNRRTARACPSKPFSWWNYGIQQQSRTTGSFTTSSASSTTWT